MAYAIRLKRVGEGGFHIKILTWLKAKGTIQVIGGKGTAPITTNRAAYTHFTAIVAGGEWDEVNGRDYNCSPERRDRAKVRSCLHSIRLSLIPPSPAARLPSVSGRIW